MSNCRTFQYFQANVGCKVYCTSTVPEGGHDDIPEEKRGEINLIRAVVSPNNNPGENQVVIFQTLSELNIVTLKLCIFMAKNSQN